MGFVVGEVDASIKGAGGRGTRQVVGVPGKWTAGQPVSEAGIGAVIPWANKLWFCTYPDENANGRGTGLWSMDESLVPNLVAETNVTSAARATLADKLFIGVHCIDAAGNVSPITGFGATDRIAAYAKLVGSSSLWAWTMDGNIWTVNTTTLVATQAGLTNPYGSLPGALNIVGQPHGKAMWGHPQGRYLFVTLNGNAPDGRLGIYDTQTGTWTDVDTGHNSWIEVSGTVDGNGHVFATGTDGLSANLWVFEGSAFNATPTKYRIPMPSEQMKYKWQQEWQRIRAVETERFLMDLHGGFFQLSPFLSGTDVAANDMPRIEPIARHMRTIPDYCFWNGYLVLAGNQATPQSANKYSNVGQPQSGLLLTTLDDIWSWGKPTGTGHWYKNASVGSGATSQKMLMRGYDKKSLHLANGTATSLNVKVLVYTLSNTAFEYSTITVPANSYVHHEFPTGFSADWVALQPQAACTDFTAWVVYT
jgi:hypothetical protein